jgi:hypothetical protein
MELLPALTSLEEEKRMQAENLLRNLMAENPHIVKKAITDLISFLIKQKSRVDNPALIARFGEVQDMLFLVQEEIRNEPLNNLRLTTERYFRGLFNDELEDITFRESLGGTHLTQIARIILRGQAPVDYYIKTHGGGLLSPTRSSGSAGPEPVDPKELFVYKVFELIGITPETHFFFEDAKNFYIAIKDAGFSEITHRQEVFLTYDCLGRTRERSFADAIEKVSTAVDVWDKETERVGKCPTKMVADDLERAFGVVELNIIKGLSKADILSRIFLLSDFTTNPGNIGFIDAYSLSEFRVIDFAIVEGAAYRVPDIFAGFISGNGRHRYCSSVDRKIRYVLHARHLDKRIETARVVLGELIGEGRGRPLNSDTLDRAKDDVRRILLKTPGFEFSALADLDDYVAGVKFNLEIFRSALSF